MKLKSLLWFVATAFLLVPSLKAQSLQHVTFNFTGIEDGYKHVYIQDLLSDEDNPAYELAPAQSFEYPYMMMGGMLFIPDTEEGYKIDITCDQGTNEVDYTILGGSATGAPGPIMVMVTGSADGFVFNIEVSQIEYNVTFNFTGVENAYELVTALDMAEDAEDPYIDINGPSVSFSFVKEANVMFAVPVEYIIDITSDVPDGKLSWTVDKNQTDIGLYYTNILSLAREADGAVFTINIEENLNPLNNVIFNFTGVEDAYELITAFDMDENAEDPYIQIDGPTMRFGYTEECALMFAVPAGYELSITSELASGTDTWYVDEQQTSISEYYTNILYLAPGANGASFDIEVIEPVQEVDYTVTFEFSGIENAYGYVVIFDMENEELYRPESSVFELSYTEGTILSIALDSEEEYGLMVTCDKPQGEGVYQLMSMGTEMGPQYGLALYAGADGYTFKVDVSGADAVKGLEAEAAEGIVRVYNLQGIEVMKAENGEELNGLTPGVYIVNGSKKIVR